MLYPILRRLTVPLAAVGLGLALNWSVNVSSGDPDGAPAMAPAEPPAYRYRLTMPEHDCEKTFHPGINVSHCCLLY